jgi:transcriptional regulator with PAS, ATPase and Fis domain
MLIQFSEFTGVCASDLLDSGLPGDEILWKLRAALIHEAMKRSKGNKCRAAKLLQIHRNSLQRWLDRSLP